MGSGNWAISCNGPFILLTSKFHKMLSMSGLLSFNYKIQNGSGCPTRGLMYVS